MFNLIEAGFAHEGRRKTVLYMGAFFLLRTVDIVGLILFLQGAIFGFGIEGVHSMLTGLGLIAVAELVNYRIQGGLVE